jgi:hypothetical protein
MAGTLTLSTLSDGTNSTASTNAILGSAKAWVNFVGSSGSINGSFNVSSVTYSSAGQYIVNFTNSLTVGYATLVTAGNGGGTGQTTGQNIQSTAPTSSSVSIYCATNGSGYSDPAYSGQMSCAIFR